MSLSGKIEMTADQIGEAIAEYLQKRGVSSKDSKFDVELIVQQMYSGYRDEPAGHKVSAKVSIELESKG